MPAAIAAVVSVLVFCLGQLLTRNAARKERHRQAMEDWLRTLSKWVDDFGTPPLLPRYAYYELTSRQVLELSLARKNRYLAWWMHEMAVAIMLRRKAASHSWESSATCRTDVDRILTDTGEYLLAWHHGKLKSSDFHISYQLHSQARRAKVDTHAFAESRKLGDFVNPVRMNARRSWALQKLVLDPETGGQIFDTLRQFIGKRYAVAALMHAVATVAPLKVQLQLLRRKLNRLQKRSDRLQGKRDRLQEQRDRVTP
ncbi:hypothetical protein ACFRJ8_16305 [Arthrobacter sp. NPDC056886]|uniref:hypothetical protein n=1 Tax=Arthrobacter sp. NPDC056886 TaxID=3345960 RepID=UPI00366DC183